MTSNGQILKILDNLAEAVGDLSRLQVRDQATLTKTLQSLDGLIDLIEKLSQRVAILEYQL